MLTGPLTLAPVWKQRIKTASNGPKNLFLRRNVEPAVIYPPKSPPFVAIKEPLGRKEPPGWKVDYSYEREAIWAEFYMEKVNDEATTIAAASGSTASVGKAQPLGASKSKKSRRTRCDSKPLPATPPMSPLLFTRDIWPEGENPSKAIYDDDDESQSLSVSSSLSVANNRDSLLVNPPTPRSRYFH
jgi:hypothetical protein